MPPARAADAVGLEVSRNAGATGSACGASQVRVADRSFAGVRLVYAALSAPSHQLDGHFERPERVEATWAALQAADFLADGHRDGRAVELHEPRAATRDEAAAVHSYVDDLATAAAQSRASLGQSTVTVADHGDPDGVTYVTPSSYADALRAAGLALELVDAVVAASAQRAAAGGGGGGCTAGVSLARPPGHHATPSSPLGFCLLNNAALAARHAQRAHGLSRVLILDYDVHSGNGTQEVFYEDPSVLFIDMHEESATYTPPHCGGAATDVGAGAGVGFTINIPLPRGAGEASALAAFDGVVAPAAERFAPELIIVSSGYDAHHLDPFHLLRFRSATYHALAERLCALAERLCGGRLVFLLEGGYCAAAVGAAVGETLRALLGLASGPAAAADAAGPSLDAGEAEAEAVAVAALLAQLRSLHGLG